MVKKGRIKMATMGIQHRRRARRLRKQPRKRENFGA
ncbi:unnamed protein product, partial [Onchocerca ochengi]|uniref:50S ribosomal protein L18 n=1 Tax=Onchocerca ochengi TaxID=42157 RepID=A0A182EZT8_ONCOC